MKCIWTVWNKTCSRGRRGLRQVAVVRVVPVVMQIIPAIITVILLEIPIPHQVHPQTPLAVRPVAHLVAVVEIKTRTMEQCECTNQRKKGKGLFPLAGIAPFLDGHVGCPI
ncbi:hypothetical protein [Paenibacillus sp. DCT19]|uniref:hypothetical protein n=1 Tax=Paenibacillus sp. DCT19 TaxID=2211212 RepID=UPI0013E2C36A|nr:hypothetical protein [Paenibacillus sp. DCT19]